MSDYDPDAFDAFEAAGWSTKDVAAYDALAGRVTSRVADPLLDAVDTGLGIRLLDVATGPGYVAERAAARGAEPVGLDFSEVMLAHVRARLPHVELVHGDATALPFPAESFDAVIGAFVLLHLGRPQLAAAEAARVLRPGGRAAFSVWNEPSRSRWLGVLLDAVHDAGAKPPVEVPPGLPIFHFADEGAFGDLLRGAGLTDVVVETVDFTLHLESGDELWNGLVEGSVRVRPLVQSQTVEIQQAIRARFDAALEAYRATAGFDVPVSVKLGSGRKPR
ncbi:MAG: class I SAM-dependent methyltransferase [Gaiellaceae bacterium]